MSTAPISVGPVDFFALSFPGNHFRGEIIPAIQELVDAGTIRVIDILFAVKEGDAEVRVAGLEHHRRRVHRPAALHDVSSVVGWNDTALTLQDVVRSLMGGRASVAAATAGVEDWGQLNTFLGEVSQTKGVSGSLARAVTRDRKSGAPVELGPDQAEYTPAAPAAGPAAIAVISLYDPETGEIAAFEELIGAHGGLGGPQTRPFLLYPADWELDLAPLVGAPMVYRQLRRWMEDELGMTFGRRDTAG